MRLSKYAGTLALDQYPKGYKGVFAAAYEYGPSVQFPRTCITRYLYSHTPPVVTETFADKMPAPNALFPLSRNTKGYAPRGKPPVIYGTDRASQKLKSPAPPGSTITSLRSSKWSWSFKAQG